MVDMLDDGDTVLSYTVCGKCAAAFNLRAGTTYPGEYFGSAKTPWVAPSCNKCLAAWRGTPN
jgi:hypothetical protein